MKIINKKTKGSPSSIDVHVGQRLRIRRSLLGLSQEKLAEAIGLTFQQVQKYERGMNRISAGRLYQFARILEVPVDYFYDQVLGGSGGDVPVEALGMSDNQQEEFAAPSLVHNKETIDLIKAYYAVKDIRKRKAIYRFIRSMSNEEEE